MRRATLTDAAGLEAEGNAEALARTAGVVRAVQGAGLVEAALLKERLDLELLDAAGKEVTRQILLFGDPQPGDHDRMRWTHRILPFLLLAVVFFAWRRQKPVHLRQRLRA